jgi:adenylyltransferase/sulfurtransferase
LRYQIVNTAQPPLSRYSRQILFADIGEAGQKKISAATVAVVGLGALGSASANALARAGVGRLKLIDRDVLELFNLQRQILYTEEDVRQQLPKAVAAEKRLRAINAEISIEAYPTELHADSIHRLLADAQVVIDACDNFETRFLINDFCAKEKIPWVYGACVGSYGLSLTIVPGLTPCFRCLVENLPAPGSSPGCDTVGIIGPIASIISAVQVAEALKLLVGAEASLRRTLLIVEVWQNLFQEVDLRKRWAAPGGRRETCPVCSGREYEFLTGHSTSVAAALCGRRAVHLRPAQAGEMKLDLTALARQLAPILAQHNNNPVSPASFSQLQCNEYLLKFSVDGFEITLFADGRAIVFGTDDVAKARSLYAQYVGL